MKHSVSGFRMAWGMFCSIPLGRPAWDESNRRSMLLALPLVGLIIGAMLGLGWLLLALLPLPPLLCAACGRGGDTEGEIPEAMYENQANDMVRDFEMRQRHTDLPP